MIIVVAGVSGSGKTTVGLLLAGKLGWPFTDGDLLHPESNIAKMASGIPLTDQDRMPWLDTIADLMDAQISADQPAVLACSALKRRYRDLLLDGRPLVRMAFLEIDRDVAVRRLAARHGHFFNPDLLDSQFADLEPPAPEESAVAVIPVLGRPDQIADEIVSCLDLPALSDPPGTAKGTRKRV